MGKNSLILLIIFLAGLVILLLPDNGKPVIKLNEMHGPSWQDLAGLILMLFTWLFSSFIIIKNREIVSRKIGQRNMILSLSIYIILIAGIFISLNISSDMLLWMFAGCAALINTVLVVVAFSKKL